jgi:predicted nucleic acid-binding protein
MTRIYIDTNVYLGFYESSDDRLTVFKEILDRADTIFLTQQTIEEFRRNRVGCLLRLSSNIKGASRVLMHTTAVVQSLPSFTKWKAAKKNAEDAAQEISDEIRSWTTDESRDAVLTEFLKLAARATTLQTRDEIIQKALQRKALGQPPTSPDKHTVGDELIWETLLTGVSDDLIVVTRDKSYITNSALLATEFQSRTGRELRLVTESLNLAFEAVGQGSEKVKAAEATLSSLQAQEHYRSIQCKSCGSRELDEVGFEGSDGDSAFWFVCRKCGADIFP